MCTQEAQNTHIATRIEISRTLVLEYKLLIRVLHSGRLIINSHDRHSVPQGRRMVDDSLEFLESFREVFECFFIWVPIQDFVEL